MGNLTSDKRLFAIMKLFVVALLIALGLLICGPGLLTAICGIPSPDGQTNTANTPAWCNNSVNLLPVIVALMIVVFISLFGLLVTAVMRLIKYLGSTSGK